MSPTDLSCDYPVHVSNDCQAVNSASVGLVLTDDVACFNAVCASSRDPFESGQPCPVSGVVTAVAATAAVVCFLIPAEVLLTSLLFPNFHPPGPFQAHELRHGLFNVHKHTYISTVWSVIWELILVIQQWLGIKDRVLVLATIKESQTLWQTAIAKITVSHSWIYCYAIDRHARKTQTCSSTFITQHVHNKLKV